MESSESRRDDDAGLIRLAQQGDQGAFERLVHRYDQSVLRLARGMVRSEDEAWDVYQETFLKAYRSLPGFRFECSFYTWIYRVATNACLDRLRRRAARREVADTRGPEGEQWAPSRQLADGAPGSNPEQLLLSREVAERLEMALRRLTPRERMVFELKHYQGLKLKAIGEILRTSEETAKNSLFRATRKLRFALADLYRVPCVAAKVAAPEE